MRSRAILVAWGIGLGWLAPAADAVPRSPGLEPAQLVTPVPESLRRDFNLAPFYQKNLMAGALPVVGSTNVSDAAMREAAWIVRHMLEGRDDILAAMATSRARLAVMAWNEFTTDIPEHAHLQPPVYWDRRARGLGATPEAPAVSCAEENLLCFPGDPYSTENICIHEFGHAIHEMGMTRIDPSFDGRLRAAYRSATNRGLWKGTYAGSNYHEYWAEATQSWFDNNRANDALHNDIDTRAKLKVYDPGVSVLCAEVYGDHPWRYRKPLDRDPAGRAHLAGFDLSGAPKFRWREPPVPEHPLVRMQTELGEFELELDAVRAPVTTRNFLRYVHEGLYFNGQFFRTVTAGNQPTNLVKIAVIQAQANPAKTNSFATPIPLERTRDTGLKHLDGTISMARDGPDSAQDEFFICIGDQPELDFGGRRNPDGQGFAAFGRVAKGMDAVWKIHQQPAEGQLLKEPVRIQGAIRLN